MNLESRLPASRLPARRMYDAASRPMRAYVRKDTHCVRGPVERIELEAEEEQLRYT